MTPQKGDFMAFTEFFILNGYEVFMFIGALFLVLMLIHSNEDPS